MAQLTDLLREIREIKASVGKVENILEERLIGIEEPSKDELEAISEYKKLTRKRQARYVPLGEALKSLGRRKKRVRSTSRKTSS
jgi:hypothetical protein